MKTRRVVLTFIFVAMLLVSVAGLARAQEPGTPYVVQPNDTLGKIAKKYLGVEDDYTKIMEATNAKCKEDRTYVCIKDPALIHPGQKLWIPGVTKEAPPTFKVGLGITTQSSDMQGFVLYSVDYDNDHLFVYNNYDGFIMANKWPSDGSAKVQLALSATTLDKLEDQKWKLFYADDTPFAELELPQDTITEGSINVLSIRPGGEQVTLTGGKLGVGQWRKQEIITSTLFTQGANTGESLHGLREKSGDETWLYELLLLADSSSGQTERTLIIFNIFPGEIIIPAPGDPLDNCYGCVKKNSCCMGCPCY